MSPFVKWFLNQRAFVFSGILFLTAFVIFQNTRQPDINCVNLQKKITKLELDLKHLAKGLLVKKPTFYYPAETDFFVHYYQGDSLVYWNTNKLPVSKFANIQFPSEGINRQQNGWYFTAVCEKEREKVAVSCLLRNEFDYENLFLENHTNEFLSPNPFIISLNPNEGIQLKDASGDYLFSAISPADEKKDNPWLLILICLGIAAAAIGIHQKSEKKIGYSLVVIGFLILIRTVFFFVDFQQIFEYQSFVSADLFGYNRLFSTFFDFCLNILFGATSFVLIGNFIASFSIGRYILPLCFVLGWWMIIETIQILVFYSAIPLNFLDLFDLNVYSYLSLFIVGFGLFSIYQVVELAIQNKEKTTWALNIFVVGLASILLVFLQKITFYNAVLPVLVLFIFQAKNHGFINKITGHFVLLILFSTNIIADFNNNNILKEQENRKLFARQIAVEQDINLELSYSDIRVKIQKDQLIQSVAKGQAEGVSLSDFGDILEKKYFKDPWDVYEQTFNLCDTSGKSLFTGDIQFYQTCQKLIDKYGEPSDIDPALFFIKSSKGGYTYIIQEKINVEGSPFVFFLMLKSKRFPEEIGFPRLLISSKANVLNSLEHYSIGKYSENKLLRSFGSFTFPTSLSAFPTSTKKEPFINYNGQNHYIFSKNNEAVVLSLKNYGLVEYVTAFAVAFCFFCLMLVCSILLTKTFRFHQLNLSLSLKIQYAVLTLVVFVLLLFAVGSGYYVHKQIQLSSDEVIEEKLVSVEEELRGKVSTIKKLNIDDHGSFLEAVLMKLARVFKTDLNIYDKDGYLVASSRSKVFNQGLLSEQINPDAFEQIKSEKASFFTQKENIGKLNYISSYQPIYNGEENLLGYVNLQHFGKQQALEQQLKSFIIAIVNVFIILLLLSMAIALFVSNWVTSPLKLLQQRISGLEITSAVKIEYTGKDEIGMIVSAYNLKLDELQNAAKKLAKSERESAWREMAQQVAHEIKNPLTPMKLSIQQMLRVYDPNDTQSTEKVKRVLNSIIEQIDGMTRIANEFSRFAKMPDPNKKNIDLILLIENTVSFFEAEENITFNLISAEKQLFMNIDKKQWVQVFNNLFQNAIHALDGKKNGEISIRVSKENNSVFIDIADNGSGISKQEQEKLFIPYFTTKSSGTGIGLSMVKQIIENHDGEISFVSELNKGTTFRIKM